MQRALVGVFILGLSLCACGDAGASPSLNCCVLGKLCDNCGCSAAQRSASRNTDDAVCTHELDQFSMGSEQSCVDMSMSTAERTCEDPKSAGSSKTIVGDWFRCTSSACDELMPDGLSFSNSGSLTALSFPVSKSRDMPSPHNHDGDAYCVVGKLGKYTFDGSIASFEYANGTQSSVSWQIVMGNRTSSGWLRVRSTATGKWDAAAMQCSVP